MTKKEIDVEPQAYRKLERCAQNKNMTVQQYVDFLFEHWPRKLSDNERTENLNTIFGD